MQKLSAPEFLEQGTRYPIIDVRTPKEFAHGHIPGAVNVPLFNDIERAVVGTSYKQEGKQRATLKGLEIVGPKLKWLGEQALKLARDKTVLVHCWRGGMRSASCAWLFETIGLQTFVLDGGYKTYRRLVLDSFEIPRTMIMLSGKTGSGKTKILHHIRELGGEILDLEALAHHKGSAFGALGEIAQPTQEQFENNISSVYGALPIELPVWVEDESRTIGRCGIPEPVWKIMRESPVILVEIDFAKRLEYLLEEYGVFSPNDLLESTRKISERLGGDRAKEAIDSIADGNIKRAIEISLEYYDKAYLHGLMKRDQSRVFTFNATHLGIDFKAIARESLQFLNDKVIIAPSS